MKRGELSRGFCLKSVTFTRLSEHSKTCSTTVVMESSHLSVLYGECIKVSSLDQGTGHSGEVLVRKQWIWGAGSMEIQGNWLESQKEPAQKFTNAYLNSQGCPTANPQQRSEGRTFLFNLGPCFASSGSWWPIWKVGVQVLPVGKYLQPHLALLCHIVNPPFPLLHLFSFY